MKPLSANAAAKAAGKAKGTILTALGDGTLSGAKNTKGQWEIDPSELARVYNLKPSDQSVDQSEKPTLTEQKTTETRVLEVELKAANDMRARLESEIEDLKVERDDWKGQAKTLLIANQNTPSDAPKKPRGWLGRIFGG